MDKVAATKTRVRSIQSVHGDGIELLPKPIARYFLGFDIEQGFWFVFVTGIVIPIALIPVLYEFLGQFDIEPALRVMISVVFLVNGCALLYLVFVYFWYPPVRIFVTSEKHVAIFCRNSSRPVSVGRLGDLRISTRKDDRTGWGEARIRNVGRTRVFLKLKSSDVSIVNQFVRRHRIDD